MTALLQTNSIAASWLNCIIYTGLVFFPTAASFYPEFLKANLNGAILLPAICLRHANNTNCTVN